MAKKQPAIVIQSATTRTARCSGSASCRETSMGRPCSPSPKFRARPWSGLDQIREMAAEINLGIRSISRLNIEQRRALIDRLIKMGAQVKNRVIYDSDRPATSPRSSIARSSGSAST